MKFSRQWAMPSHDTFSVKPIGDFVARYVGGVVVDPFARNSKFATWTNDLNPDTDAQFHLDAEEFLNELFNRGVKADVLIVDPPYSPRQISECYKSVGLEVGMKETQSALLYKRVRDAGDKLLKQGSRVLSFGWNSVGMGIKRGYKIEEILLVCHGGAHNDTICMSEIKE